MVPSKEPLSANSSRVAHRWRGTIHADIYATVGEGGDDGYGGRSVPKEPGHERPGFCGDYPVGRGGAHSANLRPQGVEYAQSYTPPS